MKHEYPILVFSISNFLFKFFFFNFKNFELQNFNDKILHCCTELYFTVLNSYTYLFFFLFIYISFSLQILVLTFLSSILLWSRSNEGKKMVMLRIRSRDGFEASERRRIPYHCLSTEKPNSRSAPRSLSIITRDRNLLLAKTPDDFVSFTDMADPNLPISSLNISPTNPCSTWRMKASTRFTAVPP